MKSFQYYKLTSSQATNEIFSGRVVFVMVALYVVQSLSSRSHEHPAGGTLPFWRTALGLYLTQSIAFSTPQQSNCRKRLNFNTMGWGLEEGLDRICLNFCPLCYFLMITICYYTFSVFLLCFQVYTIILNYPFSSYKKLAIAAYLQHQL